MSNGVLAAADTAKAPADHVYTFKQVKLAMSRDPSVAPRSINESNDKSAFFLVYAIASYVSIFALLSEKSSPLGLLS